MDRTCIRGIRERAAAALIVALAAAMLGACGGGDGEGEETAAGASPNPPSSAAPTPGSPSPSTQPTDFAPVISGKPGAEVLVANAYAFTPTAIDGNGDALAFSVVNLPSWATFDTATGRIGGTPQAQDVGNYNDVTISVTANGRTASLAPFDIHVVAIGLHSVTLSWLPPTQNEDGSALVDLAGYKIRYGQSSGNYTQTITVSNPGLSAFVVENLVKSTYYFVIAAYNVSGVESRFSNEASKAL